MYDVYVLQSNSFGRLFIGQTADLERHLKAGKNTVRVKLYMEGIDREPQFFLRTRVYHDQA